LTISVQDKERVGLSYCTVPVYRSRNIRLCYAYEMRNFLWDVLYKTLVYRGNSMESNIPRGNLK